ncbi:MAG: diacylglycerol kinase family lipid kinase [Deltaproteobacteria bacterium]|nr:diacylglycerol kinase family lipid kinase [Deltaproteobacteria bacterium]
MTLAADHKSSFFIVNPKAVGGAGSRRWNNIMRAIVEGGFAGVDWAFTEGPGDAGRLAREAADRGVTLVVSVGGDGTNNEVLNGVFGRDTSTVVGFIPQGTGGDFRRPLGLTKDPVRAVEILRGDDERTIDIGRLSFTALDGTRAERLYFNIASCGMSGVVDRYVNAARRGFGRKLVYALSTLRASFRYRPQRVRVTLDDAAPFDATVSLVIAANGTHFGNGMKIAPSAIIDDGLLDVVVVEAVSRADIFLKGWRLYNGTHVTQPYVKQLTGRKVTVEPLTAGDEVLIDLDGEVPGRLPATFEILPQAIRIKAPKLNAGKA